MSEIERRVSAVHSPLFGQIIERLANIDKASKGMLSEAAHLFAETNDPEIRKSYLRIKDRLSLGENIAKAILTDPILSTEVIERIYVLYPTLRPVVAGPVITTPIFKIPLPFEKAPETPLVTEPTTPFATTEE
jgi:hypothetical protein